MTTKKDFIHAAKTIAQITDKDEKTNVANNFAKVFSESNPRFNKAKFLTACGL